MGLYLYNILILIVKKYIALVGMFPALIGFNSKIGFEATCCSDLFS
jgi:hypothetical protein